MRALTDQQSELVGQNFPLAIYLAHRGKGRDREWRLDAAVDKLMQSAATYDPDRGKFASYVSVAIRREINGEMQRRIARHRQGLEHAEQSQYSRSSRPDARLNPLDVESLYGKAMAAMDHRERLVVTMILNGVSQVQIAKLVGVTSARIGQIRDEAYEKCRNAIGRDPFID